MTEEALGKRIARLRTEAGWTQQALAERLAISRVAVSHLEMNMSVPSERTVTLLAGLFKRSPLELVEGTFYPIAKIERLPLVTAFYTELEMQLALLRQDISLLVRFRQLARSELAWETLVNEWRQGWQNCLTTLATALTDPTELALLETARRELSDKCRFYQEGPLPGDLGSTGEEGLGV